MNAAPAPMAATTAPPSAGPTARARLKPTELSAMADGSSGCGTRSGMMACQVGPFMVAPEAQRESQPQQSPWPGGSSKREQAEHSGSGQHQALRYQQQLAAVKEIARGAGRNSHQEHGKIGRGLYQGHQQRGRRQFGHQPSRADVLHPGADVRHYRRNPQPAKPGVEQRVQVLLRGEEVAGVKLYCASAGGAFALCRARCAAACQSE